MLTKLAYSVIDLRRFCIFIRRTKLTVKISYDRSYDISLITAMSEYLKTCSFDELSGTSYITYADATQLNDMLKKASPKK